MNWHNSRDPSKLKYQVNSQPQGLDTFEYQALPGQQGYSWQCFGQPQPGKGRSALPEAHSLKQMRADIARACKRPGDPTSAANKRRDYAAAKLEDYIRRVVETAPPLTDDQRSRIAALLRNGGVSNAA